MSKRTSTISDLQPSDLVERLGLSRSYAHELVKKGKTPSLEVAVSIEREFGVPAAAWLNRQQEAPRA